MNSFKRAEIANELAHEDAAFNRPSHKKVSRDYREFLRLKALGEGSSPINDIKLSTLKKLYKWD